MPSFRAASNGTFQASLSAPRLLSFVKDYASGCVPERLLDALPGFSFPKSPRPGSRNPFLDAVSQAVGILNESGLLRLERLTTDEIAGTPQCAGRPSATGPESKPTAGPKICASIRERARGRQAPLPAYAERSGRPPQGVDAGRPLRTAFHRLVGLPAPFAAPVGLLLGCNLSITSSCFDDADETLAVSGGRPAT